MNAGLTETTWILLVDDHPIVRLGLRQLIASEFDLAVCHETDSMEGALVATRALRVDLAIVDLSLGTMDGLELIRRLHEIKPNLPVLVYSLHDEALFAELAFRAGADGYVMKQETPDLLMHAIRELL